MARGLVPCMEEGELRRSMRDTTQARQMLELAGTPPMPAMEHTAEFVARSVRGELLTPEEMEEIGMFLAAVRRVRSYLDKGMSYGIPLSCYGENLRLMTELKGGNRGSYPPWQGGRPRVQYTPGYPPGPAASGRKNQG